MTTLRVIDQPARGGIAFIFARMPHAVGGHAGAYTGHHDLEVDLANGFRVLADPSVRLCSRSEAA
jgi:hypothetical protein